MGAVLYSARRSFTCRIHYFVVYLRHPAAVLIAAVMVLISQTAFAATAPNITYKSGSSSPYSSANLEYTTNGTYTWTIPERVSQIKVTTVGAGGAYNKGGTLIAEEVFK